MCCFSSVTRPSSSKGKGASALLRRLRRLAGGAAGGDPDGVKVGGTRLFARREAPGVQSLVYSMELSVDGEVAMILPLPVVPGSGEGALTFIDMEERAGFFDELERLFEPPAQPVSRGAAAGLAPQSMLVVHTVGAYEASFVPTVADFTRLDPRFRLPDATWSALGDYRDYGFAVFKLAPATRKRVHPMAFRFRTREEDRLFFPTVHVHDGRVHDTARFDHALYYQRRDDGDHSGADARSDVPARGSAGGLVVAGRSVWRRRLTGSLPNRDTWVDGT